MPLANGCPTFFERFPTKETYEGLLRMKEWYPASKYPALNRQWDARIRMYEIAAKL